jgi:L-ascorbate metabolism protein UlaG (beta-lactamase superfamily)
MNLLNIWAKPPGSGLCATWLGHSTVLIEIDGLRGLTDPVWGPRVSPSRLLGPKRCHPVPVRLPAMPPIDLVIVSHALHDDLDYPTIRKLVERDVLFVTSLGVGAGRSTATFPDALAATVLFTSCELFFGDILV